MLACIDVGGSPVGRDMFGNGIQTDDQLYWTSDFYTRQRVYTAERAALCGYRNHSHFPSLDTEHFQNCSRTLFYVCCTRGQTLEPDCLRNGTWKEATSCNQSFCSLRTANYPCGAYWNRNAIELIQHSIPVHRPSGYHIQDFYQCGAINNGGTFQYTSNCDQTLSSYCSFVNRISVLPIPPHMKVCSVPPSLLDNTSTKVLTSHLTTILTPALPLRTLQTKTTQGQASWKTTSQRQALWKTTSQRQASWKTTSQRTASTNLITESFLTTFEQTNLHMKSTTYFSPTTSPRSTFNIFSKINAINHLQVLTTRGQYFLTQIPNVYGRLSTATHEIRQQDTRQQKVERTRSGWIIGVAVGVGIAVALTIVVIGLVFMRRRGMICQPPSKETRANVNATYGVANGDVSFTLPVVSTFSHETLPSDEPFNTFSDETDYYNVVDFNGESTPNVTIHQDDIYNNLGRRTEEYYTLNFHNNSDANKAESCYEQLH